MPTISIEEQNALIRLFTELSELRIGLKDPILKSLKERITNTKE